VETGAVAALPIWIDFMKRYIDSRGDRKNPPTFQQPGNIVFLSVDRSTGTPTAADVPGVISEAFIAGTQPAADFPRQ
jgi:membrane carboxypeptidase/penicillin-binding protein